MKFKFIIILSLALIVKSNAQITLTHNIGNTPIETEMFSCEENETWMRVFELSDFGIAPNEEFAITSAQIALSESNSGANLNYRIYSIGSDFPNYPYSLYPPTLLGSRGIGIAPTINGAPQVIQSDFVEPVIVPAGTEKILVAVEKHTDIYAPESSVVVMAGTEEDTGLSYYHGCYESYGIMPTTELSNPVPSANFFINVTGETFNIFSTGSTTRLSHNTCGDIIKTDIFSCSSSYLYWSRTFKLSDFGISENEEFVINSGQVAIDNTGWLPEINFNIYAIDENFPASFSETDLIGSSQYQQLNPSIGNHPQVIEVLFDTPITVPANVERILVEVHKGIVYGDAIAFIGGTTIDNDVSWQRGCTVSASTVNGFATATDMGYPNSNFYINVTGNVNHVSNHFGISISNICSEFLKEFSIESSENIDSVVWDFGDPGSGISNNSSNLSPFHDFSADGTYTITATVTALDGSIEVLTETIEVAEPPQAHGIDDRYACEDSQGTGISSSFDLSMIENQVLGGQINKTVTYIDGSGNEYNALPNPFTNSVSDIETITVRVANNNNPCCISETTFDLIVYPLPTIENIPDYESCGNESNGFAEFDLSNLPIELINSQPDLEVELFDSQYNLISVSDYSNFVNLTAHQDFIKARITNTITHCASEININLEVNDHPTAHELPIIYGCDDNQDGISEYFDTSTIESQVLNGQTEMSVSYFNQEGNELPSPLPNPYTNAEEFIELLTVRVTDNNSSCYAETTLELETLTQPNINQPDDLYACDQGNGYAEFDTSMIEQQLIGNQTGLTIQYYDSQNNPLPSPLPALFQNTIPFSQTIRVNVEDASNPLCYSATSFDLIVVDLPEINLKKEYFICHLEPSLSLTINSGFNSYNWSFEDGTQISDTHSAVLTEEGSYTLSVAQTVNGISCENSFDFKLVRSVLPEIQQVNFGELGNNYIEIMASGDGDFEYSIDGFNYQDSNYFSPIQGGIYTVFVRDKKGCGQASEEVAIIDYPKFFTPNNDGYNDFWQIKGITNFPNSEIVIFDRFGKILTKLSSKDVGWDGLYNGKQMMSNDYWFSADLGNKRIFSGHFTLKR